ncbi:MAG: FkbM family methyltransferase [Oscillospiraceae bacterium]|nr:FkbM family methyltransferase [Oscillospiraceae bacterium]
MSEPKISLYTRIIRFFLRDLYNRTDTLLANSRQLSESIDNLSAENRGFSKSIDNAEKNISELNEKAVRNSQIAESNMNEFNSYRNQLDERLRSDDITTIELSHRIEILESSIKNDFELFNKRTYSQSGEDSIIMYIMAMKGIPLSECSYLDLGANHPKVMSNTYFFYEQGARGVLVEANPKLADELGNERSGDIVLNKCISGKSGEKLDFNILNLDGLSKVGDVSDILFENPDARIEKTVQLETVSVNDIIEEYFSGKAPLILNLDIEGLERQILDSIDFEKYRPMIMIIEMIPYSKKLVTGQKDTELLEYVKSKGYDEYAFTGINSIFIDRSI